MVPQHCAGKEYMDAAMGLNKGHYHVRLTGQDVERGTFNHRQAVAYDQATGARHVKHDEIIPGKQDSVEIWNSPLSETAVMGFEYGFSLGARDRALVMWEAQFGDFCNNAQVTRRALLVLCAATCRVRWLCLGYFISCVPRN